MAIFTHFTPQRLPTFLATVVMFPLIVFPMGATGADTGEIHKARSQCSSVEEEIIDFESLEKQVRETKAVGVITKVKLSNDINKLLEDLKAYYAGTSKLTLEQQREQYDLLYMKIVTLVQDKDPELFNQLCNAWDPVWAELQDEKNFKTTVREHTVMTWDIALMADAFMEVITSIIPTAGAVEELSFDELVKKDLFIVITLHGALCGEVIDYVKIDEQDYTATCKNGNRYRVNVSADGKVNLVPQEK